MAFPPIFRCAVLSAIKHDYVAHGMASHPRFQIVVVADDPEVPAWAHERNQHLADVFSVPYVRNVERAMQDHDVQVAIVSPEAARHCNLSIRAARAGLHVVQDKPIATHQEDVDQLVQAIEEAGVRFLLWNRNFLPAVVQARERVAAGEIGRILGVHADFFFAKDAGLPRGKRPPGYPPVDWYAHQIAAHIDGSDGGLGQTAMGELAVEGIYPLAYIHLLTGAKVRRVFARAVAFFHQVHADNQVEDLASVTLEMDGGLFGTITVGRIGAASHPSGGEIKLRLVGSAGALVVAEARPEVGIYYQGQLPKEARQRRIANENDLLLAEDFARAVDEGRDTILGVRTGQAIFATVEAALESCRTGQVVEVR